MGSAFSVGSVCQSVCLSVCVVLIQSGYTTRLGFDLFVWLGFYPDEVGELVVFVVLFKG